MSELGDIRNTGLRGVTVASTRICDVQGEAGKLIFRGFLVQDLAEKASYEEVVYLLLNERLPTREALGRFKAQLSADRYLPDSLTAHGYPPGSGFHAGAL
jgi:citrate synthase